MNTQQHHSRIDPVGGVADVSSCLRRTRRITAMVLAVTISAVPVAAALALDFVEPAMDASAVAPDHAEAGPAPLALAVQPLAHDPGFNGGNYYADAFSGAASNYYLGKRLVRLANNDVVVAGLVPQTGAANVPGRFHLGLVRYNAAGQRIAWGAPGAFGHFSNQYITYPNTANPEIVGVVDMVASDPAQDRIYVMVNLAFGSEGNVAIATFTQQGSLVRLSLPFTTSALETGAGLVHYRDGFEGYSLVAIGNRFETTKGRPLYRRYDVTGGGMNSVDGPRDIHPATGGCSINTQTGGCTATAVTAVGWSSFEPYPPRIYVAGVITRNLAPDDTDYFVTRIAGGPGTGSGFWDPGFGTGGTRSAAWDVGGNHRDYVTAVAAARGSGGTLNNDDDTVFVAGSVAQACRDGIGIAAFNNDGSVQTSFGSAGRLRFGGTDITCNTSLFPSTDLPLAMIYDSNLPSRLVVAGMTVYRPFCLPGNTCEDYVDPMVAIVRSSDGLLQEHRDFPVQPGNRVRHGGLYDVVATAAGYTATGDDRYFNNDSVPASLRGRQEFTTVRFRLDRIFGHGFDSN